MEIQAVILAGGLGLRLQPIVQGVPKSMAPVGGRPFLEYLLLFYRQQGIQDIVLSVGHLGEKVRDHFGDGRHFGLHILYSVETSPQGTGGAILHAKPLLESKTVLVANGDTLIEYSLKAMLSRHISQQAQATLLVKRLADQARFGNVDLDPATDRVTAFREKATQPQTGWVYGGVLLFQPRLIQECSMSAPFSLEQDWLPELVQGERVYSYRTDGFFVDIGTPESYAGLERCAQFVRFSRQIGANE